MTIRILITGGTIDNCNIENSQPKAKSYIPAMLEEARITQEIQTEVLMQKDSREISKEDLELILNKCQECNEDKIIITHGTFTMPETARYLGKKIKDKTVVLTGSAIPLVKEKNDAMFNLGFALAAVQTMPNGVYIAMNGKTFNWNNVKKNLKTGNFETLG